MKKFVGFATTLMLCLVPIGALAQCGAGGAGGGCGGGGCGSGGCGSGSGPCGSGGGCGPAGSGGVVAGKFYGDAKIVPLSQIEAAMGYGYVTVSSTAHDVGIKDADAGQGVWVNWSGEIDVNGTILPGDLDTKVQLIYCGPMGTWSHTFPSSAGIYVLPVGTYTAHVVSAISDMSGLIVPPVDLTSPSTFSIL